MRGDVGDLQFLEERTETGAPGPDPGDPRQAAHRVEQREVGHDQAGALDLALQDRNVEVDVVGAEHSVSPGSGVRVAKTRGAR